MKSFKILSLILALTLVFASMTTVAFAATTETTIVADINALNAYQYRIGSATTQEPKTIVSGDYNGNDSLQFSVDSYDYGNTAGTENAIQFFTGGSAKQSLGGLTWTDYDSLKIETAIYIGDTDDGLGFRFRRYADKTTNEYTESLNGSQTLDFYVAVGGEDYNPGTVVYGYRYVAKALKAKDWNTVVIELGSTTNDVKITVNDVVQDVIMKQFNNKNATDVTVTGLSEGSYGFCGSRNRTVLVPKSSSESKLDVRLANFKMYAVSEVEEVVEVTGGSLNHLGDEKERTTGYVKYINTTNEDKEIVVVIANYDINHNLIKAEIFEETLLANTAEETTIRNDMPTATTGTVSYSKQFIWENIDGDIVPLYESMSKNY